MTDQHDDEAPTDSLARGRPTSGHILLVIDGAALQVTPLPSTGTLSVGRSASCSVVVDSGSVSRHHANLVISPTQLALVDVGSSNGTTVAGTRLTPHQGVPLTVGEPFLIGSVTLMVQARAEARREEVPTEGKLAELEQAASRIAVGTLPVLVVGEAGVGKERFAGRIHAMSPRRPAAFVRINCSAISEALLEAELFGSEADDRPGMLEAADGGTAFLCDVDQLPATLQPKLLRVLEDGAVYRTGGNQARKLDVRFVSSTSKDLPAEVAADRFRRELYFRLAGATFALPPLRERKEDVIPLAEQFIASAAGPLGRAFMLTDDAKQWLSSHDWPGNIRELRNACERAVLLATGTTVDLHHLTITSDDPSKRATGRARAATIPPPAGLTAPTAADMPSQVRATVAELEKQRILEALERCAGNQTRAAEMLGISRRTLINRLDEYGIARPRKRED